MRRISFETAALATLAGLTLFGLTGCGGSDGPPAPPIETATVRVELTDAPGNLASAWIDLSQVVLMGSGGQTLLRDVPSAQATLYNLADLDGETVQIANKGGVVPGTYGQLRFVVRQAVIKTESGEVYTRMGAEDPDGAPRTGELTCLICNRAPQGLPAFFGGEGLTIEGDETVTVVLDFDAFRSFELTGEGWDMDPVASSAVKSQSGTVTGSVSIGELTPVPESCGGEATITSFTPVLVDADNDEATWAGRADAQGNYEIDYVPAGTYQIDYVSSYEFADEVLTVANASSTSASGMITVEAGATTNLDFDISDASCGPVEG